MMNYGCSEFIVRLKIDVCLVPKYMIVFERNYRC